MANHELVIEALECLIEKQKDQIKRLDEELARAHEDTGFLLAAIVEAGHGPQMRQQIKSRKAGPWDISEETREDWDQYFELES